MTILVTGGAGYIGSHAVRQLVGRGRQVVVVDNLCRGNRAAVHPRATFYQADLSESDRLSEIMQRHDVDSVIHFAGVCYVRESVSQPLFYYDNTLAGTVSLLRAMARVGVKRMVFSSTCATYGIPEKLPILETTPQRPVSPYGWSKLFVEQILRDQAGADPEFGFVALRYFNVAGCARDGSLSEDHDPETHLIPLLLLTALGRRDSITVYGTDYPTADGTCVRDYIHVDDVCAAHVLALDALKPGDARFYNLGIGRGYSIREVIESAKRVTGREIPVEYGDRRAGEPPVLFADAKRIRRELGWSPRILDLDEIVATAWDRFLRHPDGYKKASAENCS